LRLPLLLKMSADDSSSDRPAVGFTGRARRRQTRRSVKIADAVAKYGITAGGLGVIAALALIMVFLVRVVIPLFQDADTETAARVELPSGSVETQRVALGLDENLNVAWTLDEAGLLSTYRLKLPNEEAEETIEHAAVELLETRPLTDANVTAVSVSDNSVAIGLADGTLLLGTIELTSDFLPDDEPGLEDLQRGFNRPHKEGVADVTPQGVYRLTKVAVDLADPILLSDSAAGVPVTHVDFEAGAGYDGNAAVVVARQANGDLFWSEAVTRTDLRTGEQTVDLKKFPLPRPQQQTEGADVKALLLSRGGRGAYLVYTDGHVVWYDTTDLLSAGSDSAARIAGEFDVLEPGVELTAAEMLLGDYTLILADSNGNVSGWFPTAPAEGEETWSVRKVHDLAPQPAPVTSIALSQRDRQFLTGDDEGNVWLRQMTSATTQAKLSLGTDAEEKGAISVVSTAPDMRHAAAIGVDGSLTIWSVENPHADGKLPALFLPVHYEGRPQESFVYQSSSAGDDAEPKYSLVPLVWGTLKATFYAMLFAVPIAILAAIYSSEFMQPRVRSVVKPGIEMMAGLPSVVLGYIAAQVLAPFAADALTGLLITFAAVPVGVMIFGFLWQLVPPSEVNRQGGWWAIGGLVLVAISTVLYVGGLPPLLFILALLVAGAVLVGIVLVKGDDAGGYMPFIVMAELVLSAILLGLAGENIWETLLFGGDLRAWLDGRHTGWVAAVPQWLTPLPGWLLLLTPIMTISLVLIFNLYVRPRMSMFDGRDKNRKQLAIIDLIRFAVIGVCGIAAAALIGGFFSLLGLDLRTDPISWVTGGVVDSSGLTDTFIQRNALNVGMIMGFAVIPIIYTVSEDALAAVPNTLRSASLGAGATPWQTAIRVVLPVAVSGIFSACMIGLGRAVGETMIVLMAAGNTATMNLNIFDGMRTLAANIATEMPEAPQNGTLYRVLFFSALVLFAMTFLVNTLAELVRIRFRKRAFNL
jgi:phosphate transport system permease protein